MWLSAGVVGGLVIRKPGAAVFVELVAAVVSALVGNQWGFATVWYGLLQVWAPRVVLAVLPTTGSGAWSPGSRGGWCRCRRRDPRHVLYYPEFVVGWKVAYVAFAIVSGIVIAGLGGWALDPGPRPHRGPGAAASGRNAQRV
ncbi:MAG: ECF transporter S component [Quadrisphaera sp.]